MSNFSPEAKKKLAGLLAEKAKQGLLKHAISPVKAIHVTNTIPNIANANNMLPVKNTAMNLDGVAPQFKALKARLRF